MSPWKDLVPDAEAIMKGMLAQGYLLGGCCETEKLGLRVSLCLPPSPVAQTDLG